MILMVSIWRVGHSSRDWLVGHSSLMAVMVSSMRVGIAFTAFMVTSHGLSRKTRDAVSATTASIISIVLILITGATIVSIILILIILVATAFLGALNFETMEFTLHRIIGDLTTRWRFDSIGRRDVNANG